MRDLKNRFKFKGLQNLFSQEAWTMHQLHGSNTLPH